MTRETKAYSHFCMLARAMEMLDDRWTVLVIRDLLLGRRRFTDLERRLGGITSKTLQQRLVELESNGIVNVDREVGRRDVWYELTASGLALSASFDELTAWGLQFHKRQPQPGELAHYEHVLTALRVVLDRGTPPPRPLTWGFVVDQTRRCGLRFDGDTWAYVDGEPDESDLTISSTNEAIVSYLTSLSTERRVLLPQLAFEGTKTQQKLFVRLTEQFPFGLDKPRR